MTIFFENSADGLLLLIDDRGERVPLLADMRLDFSDIAGAQVAIEHHGDRVTCSAQAPESKEPLLWCFAVAGSTIERQRSPMPLDGAPNLKAAIENLRVQLNGRW